MTDRVQGASSARPLSQPDSPIAFRLALALYEAFSCAVQRKCTCLVLRSLAGRGGRPLLGLVMGGIIAYTNNCCNPLRTSIFCLHT